MSCLLNCPSWIIRIPGIILLSLLSVFQASIIFQIKTKIFRGHLPSLTRLLLLHIMPLGAKTPTNCQCSGPHVHGHHRACPIHPSPPLENRITCGVILDPDFQNLNSSKPNVKPSATLNDSVQAGMKSPWHHFSDTHKIAYFVKLDKPATRMTNASPSIVRLWHQQVTSLPLDFGKGYLSSEPIPEIIPEPMSVNKVEYQVA
jgi:hypothetical protein